MEEDIKYIPPIVKNKLIEKRLEDAMKEASEYIDFEKAHNPEIIQALDIVKQYIIKKKLVCYGGTAMNALLPKKDKFYNSEYDLPDYDFYTTDSKKTVDELTKDLKRAGFKNIFGKVGMHEGTQKILVNYIPIADITEIQEDGYKIIFDNSKKIEQVHYANENILRMMMYLELSRPRGEVERWKKVYERLELLNKYFPIVECKKKHTKKELPLEFREIVYHYIMSTNRIVANIELESLYRKSLTSKDLKFHTNAQKGDILFYSPDLRKDAKELKELIPELTVVYYPAKGEFLSKRVRLLYNNKPLALIIEETACHSYNNVKTGEGVIRIASLETLITLHYSLYFFSNSEKTYLCDIGKCIKIYSQLVVSVITPFSVFPLLCTGYQKGIATLLHEKIIRSKKFKQKKNTTLKKNVK